MSEVKTSRTLKVSEILRGDPCYTYSSRLRERFETEINVTVELAVSQADDWDWYWAASRLLTQAGYEKFTSAVEKSYEAQDEELQFLRDASRSTHNRARDEYNRVLADSRGENYWASDDAYRAANKVYSELTEVVDAAYEAARKVTNGRVNKIAAETFAMLYIGEGGTEEPTGNDKWYGRDDDYDSEDYDDSYDENEDY